MSNTTTGELSGRIMIRPWRVGLLVDTSSGAEVRKAIASLSSVWGGYYMPILDRQADTATLKKLGSSRYAVDALYVAEDGTASSELPQSPGWRWEGGGSWGPFETDAILRKGLLEVFRVLQGPETYQVPEWDSTDPLDLFYAALWGLVPSLDGAAASTQFVRSARIQTLLESTHADFDRIGYVQATRTQLKVDPDPHSWLETGIYIVRPDMSEDIVGFWNSRSLGSPLVGVPAEGPPALTEFLTQALSDDFIVEDRNPNGESIRILVVRGLEHADQNTAQAINRIADERGWEIRSFSQDDSAYSTFTGIRTIFTHTFSTTFRPGSLLIDAPLPRVPLVADPDTIGPGLVGADVTIYEAVGQDPRVSILMPPFRRHAQLLEGAKRTEGVEQVGIIPDGIALGIQADIDRVRIPFFFNLDVMRLFFDSEEISVTQSSEGKFQMRAAEILGGPFSSALNQPGLRAAIERTASRISGISLQELTNILRQQRGQWPDPLFGYRMSEDEYVERELKALLNSGLLVPMMDVQCGYCSVTSQFAPRDLDTVIRCEFCGQETPLALSLKLALPKWRFRLASHLASEKVRALLPALAVMSTLGHLQLTASPPIPHVLGLQVAEKGRESIEVDVAAYLPRTHAVVLGEVKNSNKIDANDVANLEHLQKRLDQARVPCFILIGSLKQELSAEEIRILRDYTERQSPRADLRGVILPVMPIVFTVRDLSTPPGSSEHPWRWGEPGQGLYGVAIESCRRNLGLIDHQGSFEWGPLPTGGDE